MEIRWTKIPRIFSLQPASIKMIKPDTTGNACRLSFNAEHRTPFNPHVSAVSRVFFWYVAPTNDATCNDAPDDRVRRGEKILSFVEYVIELCYGCVNDLERMVDVVPLASYSEKRKM